MTAIEKVMAAVVDLARSEIGYLEKATNAQLYDPTANAGNGNWTKYAAEIDSMRGEYNFFNGRKNGFDWCAVYVCWLYIKLFGIDTARKMLYAPIESCAAGCDFAANYYRANNAWLSAGQTPQPAYQIFFGSIKNETHTGIVAYVKDGRVYTIEGNAGNRVQLRSYALTDCNIAGYGRPNFEIVADRYADDGPDADTPIKDDEETPVPGKTCTVTLPVLSIGARGEFVETLQLLLRHYFNPSLGLDGWFGPQTETNVKEYQRKHGEEVDGIVGPITWRLLLR